MFYYPPLGYAVPTALNALYDCSTRLYIDPRVYQVDALIDHVTNIMLLPEPRHAKEDA